MARMLTDVVTTLRVLVEICLFSLIGQGVLAVLPGVDREKNLFYLILKTLAREEMHGWAIAQRIRQLSNDVLQVNQGALYPALHRLEHAGWITSSWGESENRRRAKFYALTKAGRSYLQREQATWERLSAAIGLVLKGAPG